MEICKWNCTVVIFMLKLMLSVYYFIYHVYRVYFFQVQIPFDTYFKVEPLQTFHCVMTMEQFMKDLGPKIWPVGKRTCESNPTVDSIRIDQIISVLEGKKTLRHVRRVLLITMFITSSIPQIVLICE